VTLRPRDKIMVPVILICFISLEGMFGGPFAECGAVAAGAYFLARVD
jgi:hypothetical protein